MEGLPMTERNYLIVSAVIFGLLATAHFVRLITNFSLQVGTYAVPMWGSLLGLAIGAALSIWAFRLVYRLQGSH
jgi:hypothetical protein